MALSTRPKSVSSIHRQNIPSETNQSSSNTSSNYLHLQLNNSNKSVSKSSTSITAHVDHWSTSYRLHYDNPLPKMNDVVECQPSSSLPQTISNPVQPLESRNQGVTVGECKAVPPQFTSADKIRKTIEASRIALANLEINDNHELKDLKTEDANVNTNTNTTIDPENVPEENLSILPNIKKTSLNWEDDEMDGRKLSNLSECHGVNHVETGTLSQSSLGHTTLDLNNSSSLDSLTEDNIESPTLLSTIPNPFCTSRDAVDLRHMLLLTHGVRGGIVPASASVMDMYMVGKVVGVGSYGKVRAAWHRLTGTKVAIKTYDKSKMKDDSHWKRVHCEIRITEQVSHPRIARMYEAIETPKRMHLIMECLDGPSLCSHVKERRRLSEEEARSIFFQLAQSIDYLHSLNIAHRDVKLENVLFTSSDEKRRDIKLIDFGFSTVCQPGKKQKVFCGTPSYMAPEIVKRSEYEGRPVDIWSLGVLLYALLCGCFPFRAKTYPDLYRRIARGTFSIPEEISAPVKDLLLQLLEVDINRRITARDIIRHSWLQLPLALCPDIKRLRADIPFLISDRSAEDLDEEVLNELDGFGVPRDEICHLVVQKLHSSLTTLYYLMLDIVVRKRRKNNAIKSSTTINIVEQTYPSLKSCFYNSSEKHKSNPDQLRPKKSLIKSSNSNSNKDGGIARPKSSSGLPRGALSKSFQNGLVPVTSLNISGHVAGTIINGFQRPLSAYASKRG